MSEATEEHAVGFYDLPGMESLKPEEFDYAFDMRRVWMPTGGGRLYRGELDDWLTRIGLPATTDEEWEQELENSKVRRDAFLAAERKKVAEAEEVAALRLVDWADPAFWSPPEPQVFIPGMLLEGQVGTIYSRGGVGKSLLSLDVVIGLCVRGDIFGSPVDPQKVLYIDREGSVRGLSKRIKAMGLSAADSEALKDRLHYSLLGALTPLDTLEGGIELMKLVNKIGARIVVIDTLSKIVEGEENANPTWQGVHNHTLVWLKSAGVTVLQIDHTGKDTDRGQRGASAKRDNADVVWHLSEVHKGTLYRLDCHKDREGDFGGEGSARFLVREEFPVLRHRFATDMEVLAAGAAAQNATDKANQEKALGLIPETGEVEKNTVLEGLGGVNGPNRGIVQVLINAGEITERSGDRGKKYLARTPDSARICPE